MGLRYRCEGTFAADDAVLPDGPHEVREARGGNDFMGDLANM